MPKTTSRTNSSPASAGGLATFWHRRRYLVAFFGAVLALSFVVPWLEFQGKSMGGVTILLNWSSSDPMLQTAFWHPTALIGIALLIVLLVVLAVLGFREVQTSRHVTLGLIWALAALSTWPATVIFLNSQSDNVKGVVFILGYWLSLFGSASLFVYSLLLMADIDASEHRETSWLELALPAVFVLISVMGALINYKWVNYELVPPATKIVRSVKSSR